MTGLEAGLYRPDQASLDVRLSMEMVAPGSYRTKVNPLKRGPWQLNVFALAGEKQVAWETRMNVL